VAGAALQPTTASLHLRKQLPALLARDGGATTRLGQRAVEVLAGASEDSVFEHVGAGLGRSLVLAELVAARSMRERLGHVEVAILARRWIAPAWSRILLERHIRALELALERAERATHGLVAILLALASPQLTSGPLGAAPLGAVLAGLDLGAPLVGQVGDALLQAARRSIVG
jgi:hypothetical protein